MPKDVEIVRDKVTEIFSGNYFEAQVSVVPDNDIKDGGVIVQTSNGLIDASIDTQLAIIEKALKKNKTKVIDNIFGKTMSNIELHKMKIMMLILAFNLAITFPFTIYSSIISAYEKFVFQKLMAILNTILKPLLMIPLLFMGYKSIAMTVIITIVNIIVLV